MTKKTKTLLIILVTVLLITGIGVVVLATTELGKGTIFQKEEAPETVDEVENTEEKTSSEQEENSVIYITVEEGLHDDGYVYFNMTPEDLETQEAREATFRRLLSLIPEGYDLHGKTPELVVRLVMIHNLVAYHIDEIIDNCPYGYAILDPYFLNEDLTINTEKAYARIPDGIHANQHPIASTIIPGQPTHTKTNYDNGDIEDYYDYSQVSSWTLDAFNDTCNRVEQSEYASTWEITRTNTYFKATDKWGCYCEIDCLGKYVKNYHAYYVDDETIKAYYDDPNIETVEEYRKTSSQPRYVIY